MSLRSNNELLGQIYIRFLYIQIFSTQNSQISLFLQIISAQIMRTTTAHTAPLIDKYETLVLKNEVDTLRQMSLKCSLWFFNTPSYIAAQKGNDAFTFILTDTLTRTQVHGVLHLFVHNQEALSPLRAPFGSLELAEGVSYALLQQWLSDIESYCRGLGINHFTIKHYPECYDFNRAVFVKRGLLRSGFEVKQTFENQHIEVNDGVFEGLLHPSERRRLRKCMQAGFCFEQWTSPNVSEVYDFIFQNRRALGYRMSFDENDLHHWFAAFPERFAVFRVRNATEITALALVVRVGAKVLYNFCPVNALAYRAYSPAVMLTAGLYGYCQQNDISVLDLGISVDSDGLPKPSLVRFKRNLGAKSSLKMIFERNLEISP